MVDLNSRIHHNGKPPYKHTNLNTQNTVFDSFKTYIGLNQLGFHSKTIKYFLSLGYIDVGDGWNWWQLWFLTTFFTGKLSIEKRMSWFWVERTHVSELVSLSGVMIPSMSDSASGNPKNLNSVPECMSKVELMSKLVSMSVYPWFWPFGSLMISWSMVGLQLGCYKSDAINQIFGHHKIFEFRIFL